MSITYILPLKQFFRGWFNFIHSMVQPSVLPSSIPLLTPKLISLLNSIFPSPPPTLGTTAPLFSCGQVGFPVGIITFFPIGTEHMAKTSLNKEWFILTGSWWRQGPWRGKQEAPGHDTFVVRKQKGQEEGTGFWSSGSVPSDPQLGLTS